MLRENNNYLNYLRFTSGRENSMADKSSRNNISLCNGLLFGSGKSFPQGYNSQIAIGMPLVSGAKMAVTIRGNGSIQANSTTKEKGISTIQGGGSVIANMSSAEAMAALLQGSGTFQSSGIMIEVLSATLDAGAKPSAFDIAQEIWQSKAINYMANGTMGKAVNSAGSAGDPWNTVMGTYGEGTAGKILLSVMKMLKFLQIK